MNPTTSAPTPSTIEALEEAIRMLEAIERGNAIGRLDYMARLAGLKEARDEHYRSEMKAERTRAQIRELARRARKELPHG